MPSIVLNRPNVDEVTSVYGSPVFCGATPTIPRHYNDGVSRAIQAQSGLYGLPKWRHSQFPVELWRSHSDRTALFIPTMPNSNFGLPRTMLNPRQLQFSLRFSF